MTPEDQADFDRFVRHTREHTVKGMIDSAWVVSIVPDAEDVDVKFAVELGLAIMLDKPILAILHPGAKPPAKLLLVADELVHADLDLAEGREKVLAAIQRLSKEIE